MSLHTVGAADEQHRIVKYLQCPFHLRRKIHMPRRIEQGELHILIPQQSLLGKYGDPPLFFQFVGI